MTPTNPTTRHGFHYYPDLLHYAESDLHRWLPELKALGASWLTLLAPVDRAIPEYFIRRMMENGIEPILHFPIPTSYKGSMEELALLFNVYARWGVQYITLFDRPNLRKNWSASEWTKNNLVERFLDIYLPLAESICQAGMTPVFPPLEPGGDYWDTAFLHAALQGIQRRSQSDLIQHLALGAYAWTGNRSPNWGAGGPERWPRTRPYSTPQDSEDHMGFRIFDWYLATSQAATGTTRPILLLAGGSLIGNQIDPRSPAVDVHAHTWQNMTLVEILAGQSREADPVPPEVLTCNFWLLAAENGRIETHDAWYKPDHDQLPIVDKLKEWVAGGGADLTSPSKTISPYSAKGMQPISHYLLLPSREWSSAEFHLEAIRPFINKYKPTIGFSPVEASHAKKVTVIGGASSVPESIIDGLLAAGCVVEQISGDGMNIAT